MTSSTFADEVNYHIQNLIKLTVPAAMAEARPEATAEQAAVNIITELGLSATLPASPTTPNVAKNVKAFTIYALAGHTARGPHDPFPTVKRVCAVFRDGACCYVSWPTIDRFCEDAADYGWMLIKTSSVSRKSTMVREVFANGFIPHDTVNYFSLLTLHREA